MKFGGCICKSMLLLFYLKWVCVRVSVFLFFSNGFRLFHNQIAIHPQKTYECSKLIRFVLEQKTKQSIVW